jgi:hypothetical protein
MREKEVTLLHAQTRPVSKLTDISLGKGWLYQILQGIVHTVKNANGA